MIYSVCALLLAVLLISVTVFGEKRGNASRCWKENALLAAAGFLLIGVDSIYAWIAFRRSDATAETMAWARDMLSEALQAEISVFLILVGIVLAVTLLARFDNRPQRRISRLLRITVSTLSSLFLLLITPFYAYQTDNRSLPLLPILLLAGIGLSLLMRLTFLVEYTGDGKRSDV